MLASVSYRPLAPESAPCDEARTETSIGALALAGVDALEVGTSEGCLMQDSVDFERRTHNANSGSATTSLLVGTAGAVLVTCRHYAARND